MMLGLFYRWLFIFSTITFLWLPLNWPLYSDPLDFFLLVTCSISDFFGVFSPCFSNGTLFSIELLKIACLQYHNHHHLNFLWQLMTKIVYMHMPMFHNLSVSPFPVLMYCKIWDYHSFQSQCTAKYWTIIWVCICWFYGNSSDPIMAKGWLCSNTFSFTPLSLQKLDWLHLEARWKHEVLFIYLLASFLSFAILMHSSQRHCIIFHC